MITALIAMAAMARRAPDLMDVSLLAGRFNAAKGEVRLVMILSPTEPSSLGSARLVRREVIDQLTDEPFKTFVVWTPMRPDDTRDAAQKAADLLDTLDVDQFWDATHSLARQYGELVSLPNGRQLAWNVYLLHGRTQEWLGGPPKPVAWMHKLGADQRTLDGPTLLDLATKEIKKPLRRATKHKG